MAKNVTAIEICESSIKVVSLSQSGKAITVNQFNEFPTNGEDISQVLARLRKDDLLKEKSVFTGLPSDKVLLRETTLPFRDKKRIEKTVAFALADSLPFPVEEAAYSYYLMEAEENKTKVVSFLVQKKILEQFRETLTGGGITAKTISVESAAIATFIHSSSNENAAYVSLHLDMDKATLTILGGKKVLFTRKLNTKLRDLISSIATKLKISEEDAKSILFSGIDKEESKNLVGAHKIIRSALDQLIREVELSFKSFGINLDGSDKIILSGEGAQVEGLIEYFENATARHVVPVKLGDQFQVGEDVNAEELTKKGIIALGYALMGIEGATINFIKGEFSFYSSPLFKILHKQKKLLAIAATIITILYSTSLLVEVRFQKQRYLGIKDQITELFKSTLPNVKKIVNAKHQLTTALTDLEEKASLISDNKTVFVVDILKEISSAVPDKVDFNITRMRIGRDGIRISGETANFDGVEKIKQSLKKAKIFKSVDVGGAKTSKFQNIVEFKLNIKLEK